MRFLLSLVFFCTIFSLSASPVSVSPNPGYVNQSFTFTVTLSSALPRENDLRIALGDGGGGWLDYKVMEENSNRTYFSYSKTIKKAGDRVYKIGIFSNGALYSETQTYHYTVLPPEADSISNNTATLGEFTNFMVRGRGFSPDFVANIEGTSNHCDKESVSFSHIDFRCRPTETGRKRFYFKDQSEGNTVSGSESWYIEITQPIENTPPVLQSHSSPNSRYEIGDEVTFVLSAHDSDGNLRQIDVDWNDDSGNEVEGRQTTNYEQETFSRTFNTAGQYTISSTAYDEEGATSETLRWTITIEEASDVNNFPELTIIEKPREEPQYSYVIGEQVDFTVSAFDSDGNLKQIDVNWDVNAGTNALETQRATNNESHTFSRSYSASGIYRVSVAAVDELGATSSTQYWSILIRPEDTPSSYDFKICSDVQSSSPFDCTKEQSSFDEAEDIFAWVKFEGLSNGPHVVEWRFVNSQLGTEERESSTFTWNEDQWYKAYTRLVNKQPGNWSVEYYLNSEKIGEKSFVIQSEAPTANSFSPSTIVQNQPTEITIEGEQLGSDFVANIEGSESHCHNEGTNNLGTQLKLTCTAEVTGNKRLFLKNRQGGETISGSEDWYIQVTPEQTPNQPPEFVSGYAAPSSVQIGGSISFEAIFKDVDSENFYNATVHYRIQGEENWSLLVLDAISGNVRTGYTFVKSTTFDIAGQYEFRFSAEDNQGQSVTTEVVGNFQVSPPNPDPTANSFSPTTIVQNQPTEITIEGELLGSDFVANIEGSESHCHNEGTNNLGTQLKLTCTAEVTGNKRLFLKNRQGGETISGSENWYIQVTPEQTPNQPPEFVSGHVSPSSVQIGESTSFEAIFKDADSESIYNATVHYRIQGEGNWSYLLLDAISGNVSTGYTFGKSAAFDTAGQYEFRFSAEDNQGESVTTEIIDNFIVESPDPFTLSVVSNNGRTTAVGIDCPGDCSEVLYEPVYLTFTSEPNFGYSFIRWSISGSCESTSDTTNTTIELFIKGDCNAEAIFGLPDSNSAPIITLVEHGKTENKYEGIDFLRSKSGKYLKISDKAVILFKVDDPDEDLDYLDVNFDGSERPPVKVNLDHGSGLYYAEHEYEKSNYPDATTEPFWKRENLEWSAVAYDKNGNASNKLSNSGFGIYDSDDRQKYIERKLQAEREKLSEILSEIDRAQRDIEIITSTILKSDTTSEIDLYISESLSNLNLEDISYNIDSEEKCLWLDIHNNCLIDQHQSDQKQYSYTIEGEDERYNYLIYVKYSEEAPFPASVWVEYSLDGQELITPSFQANNSKHLKLLSNLLSEDVKNDIDIYESSSIPPLDHKYKSVCYIGEEDSLSLADVERLENSIPEELAARLKNAVTLSFNTYKDEIVATGNSVANGINIALDSNASIKDRAHGAVSFTYKIPLGTLKAIFSVVDSAIYGAGQPEIDAFLRKTQGITSAAFNSLDEEFRNEVLTKAGDIADVINSNDELRASFELATLGIGGKYKKATNRKPGVIASRALSVKKKFLKTTSQPLSKIKAVKYATYLGKKEFDKFGISVELTGKNKDKADDIANGGKGKNDPDGKKTEELNNNVFQEMLGDTYKSYQELGCYYTNCKHGFDDIFIEGPLDNPTKIVIVESKQLHNGAATLTKGKGDNHDQMSDEWIKKVLIELVEQGGEKKEFANKLLLHTDKIEKYVAGVNRKTETLDIIKIK
ncbi:cadherin repeat domain-containing protein [Pseudoalteromonas rubra]|uniref:cadherin repeat domain-containing protein n=1 Tax=Pseudoalteromonas rubra TaxID=43658 RepID=UPI000F78CAC7|nr:cadherin repeat domain-containing protein [Pseudoalteromonas rubra]